ANGDFRILRNYVRTDGDFFSIDHNVTVAHQLTSGADAGRETETENQIVQTALEKSHQLFHPVRGRTFFSGADEAAKLFFAESVVHANFLFLFQAKSVVGIFAALVAVLSRRIRTSLESAGFAKAGQFCSQAALQFKAG